MKKILIMAIIAGVSLSSVIFAEEITTSSASSSVVSPTNVGSTTTVKNGIRQEIKNIKDEAIQQGKALRENFEQTRKTALETNGTEVKAIRESFLQAISSIKADKNISKEEATAALIKAREEVKTKIEQQIEATKQMVTQKREEFKSQIEANRETVKTKTEEQKTALKEKLQTIKDEKKKQIVENVADQLEKINVKYVDHLSTVLDNIENVLQGIKSRTEKAEVDGKDVTTVKADITAAETAIASARAALSAQASVTYPITISTENNLKNDVSLVREKMRTDLNAAKEIVQKAHQAVRKAGADLASIQGINKLEVENQNSTSSNQ